MNDLVHAAERGRVGEVERWLDVGADVNGRARNGEVALLTAARHGQREVVEVLLQHGAEILEDKVGKEDALSDAAFACSPQILGRFLGPNSDLSEASERNAYLLFAASSCADASTLRLLLEHGLKPALYSTAEPRQGALHRAACSRSREIVELLIQGGQSVASRNGEGRTPLIEAARCGKLEQLEALLRAGAELDAVDGANQTALMVATRNENAQVVAALLRHGARADVVDEHGKTALDYAERQAARRPEILEMLTERSPARTAGGRSTRAPPR